MKEHPILFRAPMVRAILESRKTQTRRIAKMKQSEWCKEIKGDCWHPNEISEWRFQDGRWFGLMGWYTLAYADCPYGQLGDRLYVRETWALDAEDGIRLYRADNNENTKNWDQQRFESGLRKYNWRPSIHMPRWVSRILLEITGVRVERLQDISEVDAQAEGATPSLVGAGLEYLQYRAGYQTLWESINGAGSWDTNPWVWVIEFKVVKP